MSMSCVCVGGGGREQEKGSKEEKGRSEWEQERERERESTHNCTPTNATCLWNTANVRRAVSDQTTYQVPQPEVLTPLPVPVLEPAIEEGMEEEPPSPTSLEKRAESVESLLSLSDVEVGMEEHAGDFDEIDYHKRKIRRRVGYMYISSCWHAACDVLIRRSSQYGRKQLCYHVSRGLNHENYFHYKLMACMIRCI